MSGPEFRDLIKKQPFTAVRLHMADGRTFDIRHPEMVFITIHTAHVGKPASDGSGLAEDVEYVSLRHIVSVEPLETSMSTQS